MTTRIRLCGRLAVEIGGVARSQAGMAEALRRLGDHARAAELSAQAAAAARALGMARLQRELEQPVPA